MVVNRLQNGLINSSIAPWTSKVYCQNFFFFKWDNIFFFSNSDRDFYSENKTTMYHKYTLKYQKFTRKNLKNGTIVYVLCLAAYLRNPTCYYLSFVFPDTLIGLLHCNAMHFDSFSLGVRYLFKKLVLFFLYEVILVIHCCFQN
jgi:hypothetical protein